MFYLYSTFHLWKYQNKVFYSVIYHFPRLLGCSYLLSIYLQIKSDIRPALTTISLVVHLLYLNISAMCTPSSKRDLDVFYISHYYRRSWAVKCRSDNVTRNVHNLAGQSWSYETSYEPISALWTLQVP